MQGRGKARSIADGANNPGQGAAPIQLQRDDSIPGGSQGICCSCVSGSYKLTVLVAAQPCLFPCMMCVSSPVVPIAGSVQDICETVTTWPRLLETG